ncbi:MAG: SDR family oxidoreductase [Bacteroidia bacterium]|nr:SDR family oxidoreductase [Bacteroidia bacterium]
MFKPDTLSGKVILITGGGSGLGLAMANCFASLGASIAICGRTESKLLQALEEIQQKGTPKAKYYIADVRQYDQVKAMLEAIIQDFGQLDCLVNNAAGNFLSASEDLTPNAFKAVVDIVLHGSFHCSQLFGKYLIEQKRPGNILNIVTTYTETGCAFVLPSACAKAGVYAMTTSLAYEWAPFGIRVNAIAPGAFPTEGAWSRLMPSKDAEQLYLSRIPIGRVGKHDELAHLAAFLLSDLPPFLTGECINIDGGERLSSGQFNFLAQLMSRNDLKQVFLAMKPKKS